MALPLAACALLLAGCLGGGDGAADDGTTNQSAFACERCLFPVDEEPSRSHFENFLAASPRDDRHLVVAACTFDGERFQVTAHATFDQGRTWTVAELPYGERVPIDHPLRPINFAADPGVAIGPDGKTVIVSAVGLTTVPVTQLRGNVPVNSIMFVARSDDGGRTFPPEGVTVLQSSPQTYPAVQDFSDHPRIVAGPDGTFLVMWGSLDLPDPTAAARFLETQDPLLISSLEVRFSYSFDGGRRWSESAIAYQDTDLHYYPPSPVILDDETWMVMPNQYNGGDGHVFLSVSDDFGASWSWEPTPMAVRGFGTPAADPATGRIYYSYNERADGGGVWPTLAVAEAPGAPWTLHRLTDAPTTMYSGIENMLAIDGRGIAHVSYGWMPQGAAAGDVRVTSFDPQAGLVHTTLEAGVAPDRAFGHYMGLAGTRSGAVATWPVAVPTDEGIWGTGFPLLGGVVEGSAA